MMTWKDFGEFMLFSVITAAIVGVICTFGYLLTEWMR